MMKVKLFSIYKLDSSFKGCSFSRGLRFQGLRFLGVFVF